MDNATFVDLTAEIVSTYVSNNQVDAAELPRIVQEVHAALTSLGQPKEEAPQEKVPVVSVRASVKPDYIVCMECGKKQKMLKRHLQTAHGMTPEQYRRDYGLPANYPMAAPNYSERRAQLARDLGLGRKKEDAPKARRRRKAEPQGKAAPE